MRRREVVGLLGATAAAWPLAARAQQVAVPVVGYLDPRSPEPGANRVAACRKGLSETGYVEGRNVVIEYRWGYDDFARVPELVADLVRRQVTVITIPGSDVAVRAAKAATSTIPIVFSTGTDPVQAGLVTTLNRPGGNITGLTNMSGELGPKRLGLLRELLPGAARIAALTTATNPSATESGIADLQRAAAALNGQIEVFYASTNREIDAAFVRLVQKRPDALLVMPFTFFSNRRVQLVTLAAHHRMPTFYYQREFVEAGGLISYGANILDRERQLGLYTGRILKGEKPADLPVMQPTKFEFVINLQTARTLGIEVPLTVLAIADEVIE